MTKAGSYEYYLRVAPYGCTDGVTVLTQLCPTDQGPERVIELLPDGTEIWWATDSSELLRGVTQRLVPGVTDDRGTLRVDPASFWQHWQKSPYSAPQCELERASSKGPERYYHFERSDAGGEPHERYLAAVDGDGFKTRLITYSQACCEWIDARGSDSGYAYDFLRLRPFGEDGEQHVVQILPEGFEMRWHAIRPDAPRHIEGS